MRAVFVFLLGLLVGACVQASAPPREVSARDLETMTVALVRIREDGSAKAFCSGVWVNQSTILTAAHCVDDEDEFHYAVRDDIYQTGSTLERTKPLTRLAKLVALDEDHDLALLRDLDAPMHGVARVRSDVPQGLHVATMGHPLGLWWSYSSGDVAAVRALPNDPTLIYVQTTAPTSPGNSGCGLFDGQGFLVGIAHAGFVRGSNIALYIHAGHIQDLLEAHR